MGGILVLYSSDTESVKNDFLQHLKGLPFELICIEDHSSHFFHSLKNFTSSRRQIVLLSRGYLNCLQGSLSFSYLNPLITIGLLCCGLEESDFKLYYDHSPLKFCDTWPRFEVKKNGERSVFPNCVIKFLQAEFLAENLMKRDIVVMPELINKVKKCSASNITCFNES